MLDAGIVVAGTPDDVLEVLRRFQGVGVDQVIIHMQMGGVPHDEIMAASRSSAPRCSRSCADHGDAPSWETPIGG